MAKSLSLLLLPLLLVAIEARINLNLLSNVYLPISRDPDVFQYNSNSATCGALDVVPVPDDIINNYYFYVGGSNLISVYQIDQVNDPQLVYTKTLISGTVGDLEICGSFVAVAFDNAQSPEDGKVIIFRRYANDNMEKLHEIPVGTNPRDIDFTDGCRKIVVAVEGTLSNIDGNVFDPEGVVAVISWQSNDLAQPYTFQVADFTDFNDRSDEYIERGVRWVYRGENSGIVNTFSQDMEPESVTVSTDGETVYILLQENNAVAVMNLENATVDEIYPFGKRDFNNRGCDSSDRDGGIRINPWPMQGILQPSRIDIATIAGTEYIVTVNEGAEKEYSQPQFPFTWRESKTGQELIAENLVSNSTDSAIKAMLSDDAQLGRTRFSTVDNKNEDGYIQILYTYGGRSFSLYYTNITSAYESGDNLEQATSSSAPSVFNADPTISSMTPVESYDLTSTMMGPRPDALAIATINGDEIIFVGAGRPGHIIVYRLPQFGPIVPTLEGLWYEGGQGASWQELYDLQETRNLGIEQIEFIPASRSPNNQNMLIVIGKISGTVAFYRVTDTAESKMEYMSKLKNKMADLFNLQAVDGNQGNSAASSTAAQPAVIVALGLSSLALILGVVLLALTVKKTMKDRPRSRQEEFDSTVVLQSSA